MMYSIAQTATLTQRQTIDCYFQTFNLGTFEETAQLFSEMGQLLPPFEDAVVGRVDIERYLKREAAGMRAVPNDIIIEPLEGDRAWVTVRGHVEALVFRVNTAWQFTLNAQNQIEQVQVQLLASLQELLTLRPMG